MRSAALALACALLGAGAALGIALAAGLLDRSTTRTVVVREPGPPRNLPAAVRSVAPVRPAGFSPARIYARRSPGVVTIYSTFGGTAAQGSGFVVSRSGLVLTNAHVITTAGETTGPARPAAHVYVAFADGDRIPARIVGWDVFDDVGVVRVARSAHALVPLPLGRSTDVVVGEPVAAIGSPLGNTDSLAAGIVSAVRRSIASLTAPSFQLIDAIQTDAPIAHGSSGGPLLDAAGRVIGITAQLRSDQGGPSGVGFAVPIDAARRSLHDLLTKGHVAYAFAGLETENLTPALAAHLRLHVSHGALVDRAEPGGPAAEAGIRGGASAQQFEGQTVRVGGDVVVAIDGLPVASADDLVRIVTNRLRPGETALFTIVRAGRRRAVPVTLVARAPG
ncbi:MAG TPA: trypsin-like peptidase domain-containing protein [Gaiellaceae bacterium]|nr:trypsin-like peptidase domain-containing protein [Gaiellaceae bacterium]